MLLEALEYLCTPASGLARRSGLTRAAIGIRSRHARCRTAWAPHLARTRGAMVEAADLALSLGGDGSRAGLCVVVGAGSLLDVPLAELAARFQRVILADVVWTWPARWAARRFPHVELRALDMTAMLDQALPHAAGSLGARCPTFFLDLQPDLVVSANLLSQLPLCFRKALADRPYFQQPGRLDALCAGLVHGHLDWLEAFGGVRLLVCDTAWKVRRRGEAEEIRDPLYGAGQRIFGPRWDWDVALAPEIDARTDVVHEVCAMLTRGPCVG